MHKNANHVLKYVEACLEFVCFAKCTKVIRHNAIATKTSNNFLGKINDVSNT